MTQAYHSDPRGSDSVRDGELIDDDPSFEDARVVDERNEERERAQARNDARERAEQAATGGARHEPPADGGGLGTSYLGNRTTEESWEEWRKIQADFVDNPREAVSKANGLVGDLINDIVRQFETERNQMEQRWSSGEDVSTEELRKCLQTYRDFFGRLLAKVDSRN
jgi:hypothetical protein